MYHIVNDKRAKVSARLIYEGLLECLKKKPFNKITIRDIQESSGVGRATFYRHFDSLSDVLTAKCDKVFSDLSAMLNEKYPTLESKRNPEGYLLDVITYLYDNWEIFEILVRVGKRDILYSSRLNYAKERTKIYAPELDEHSIEFQMISHVRAGIMDSIMNIWLEDGRKEKPEEIVRVIHGEGIQRGIRFMMEASGK